MSTTTATNQYVGGGNLAGRGFLPSPDPVTRLPNAYARWDELGYDLPKLLAAEKLHQAVRDLPILDPAELADVSLERAMVVLSFLGHAYVWERWRDNPAGSIPASIAVPWYEVARRLGRPPVLSYASYALHNWRRIDATGPIEAGNVALIQNFLGGLDEEWFVVVHVDIEAKAAPALAAIEPAQRTAAEGNSSALAGHLATIAGALRRMYTTLERMPENCDPYIYYHRVRPYIHGFYHHPVVYEGVTEYGGEPQRFFGETGAQSTIIPAIDALLDVQHANDELRTYLNRMREYMPPEHQAFLARVEGGPSVRAFVERVGGTEPAAREMYNECIHLVEQFRSKHLEYAAAYIQKQAPTGPKNSTHHGTGGTPFMPYLKKHRDETAGHVLPGSSSRAEVA